jgi:hypothetical protein
MIEDADLLQANVTIITGILIFLSITPIFRQPFAQLVEKSLVMAVLIFIISMLLGSVTILLLANTNPIPIPIPSFSLATVLFVTGLGGVLGLVIGLSVFYNKIRKMLAEKEKD